MDQSHNRLAWLFFRYIEDTCSPEEREEFLALASKEENQAALNLLMQEAMDSSTVDEEMRQERADEIFNTLVEEKCFEGATGTEGEKPRLILWRKLAVAASVLLAICLLLYQMLPSTKPMQTAKLSKTTQPVKAIVPGHNGAVLILSNGSTIILDSVADGTLAAEGKVNIEKLDGQIRYTGNAKAPVPVYNTIRTAKGNQYHVLLSDGTKVWLNAASSLHFPAVFSGDERRVRITGEAYFEVAHNANAPFRVEAKGTDITVLGTRFNVNAYDDEANIRTTLLEGAVKLTSGRETGLLKPGQQASVSKEGQLAISNNVDIEEAVAWKNGVFIFNHQRLESIMRQISRWYDVAVVYEGKESRETFSGVVSRNADITQVLRIMEANGIRFRMEGKTITVVR